MFFNKVFTLDRKYQILLLIIVSIFLFYYHFGTPHIFFTDELLIEEASFVMGKGGNLLVPVLDGIPHFTKPPLLYWQTAPLYYFVPRSNIIVRFWMPIYG